MKILAGNIDQARNWCVVNGVLFDLGDVVHDVHDVAGKEDVVLVGDCRDRPDWGQLERVLLLKVHRGELVVRIG